MERPLKAMEGGAFRPPTNREKLSGAGRSSRQGCHLAGASPAMSVAQIRHVAIPQPEVGNPWGDAWCKRPGRPVVGLRWERSGGLASGGA
jgi:hypothetical protein